MKKYITTEEALTRHDTSRSKLSRLARAGQIRRYKSARDSRVTLYNAAELDAVLGGEPVTVPLDPAA